MTRFFFLAPLLVLAAACTPSETDAPAEAPPPPELTARPALDTAADSLAWRMVEAAGGLDAWYTLGRLRFDFAVARDTVETFRARHLWDRSTGRYRVEYPVGEDSVLVALFDAQRFDPAAPAGSVFLNGAALDSAATRERLIEAYERFVNDSYWLLAPLKLFDPGVRRALAPDSSTAGLAVLQLAFENVGLTPGDRYWLAADSTGTVRRWSFVLEGGGGGSHTWEDPVELPTAQGALRLATRKQGVGRAILTPVFSAEGLPADVFERPTTAL